MLSTTEQSYEEMWAGRRSLYVLSITCPKRLNFMYFVVRNLLDSFSVNADYDRGLMDNLSETTKRDCANWEKILKMIQAKAIVLNVTFSRDEYKKYQNM